MQASAIAPTRTHMRARRLGALVLFAVVPLATAAAPAAPVAQGASPAVLAAVELRVGVERMAKLRLEQAVVTRDGGRSRDEYGRTRERVVASLQQLRADGSLSARRRGQLERVSPDIERLAAPATAPQAQALGEVYRDSEALAARLGFLSTGLSAEAGDSSHGALVDLIGRAAASAQRVGKLQFASHAGTAGAGIEVDARQAITEFTAALEAIDQQGLPDPRMRDELALARQQWLLFSAALGTGGLVKESRRLGDVATTADRIAQSLMAMAHRAMGRPPVLFRVLAP